MMRELYNNILGCLFGLDRHVIGIYRLMRLLHLHVPCSGFLIQFLRHFLRIYSSC